MLMVAVCAHAQSEIPIPYNVADFAWLGPVELFAAYDPQHGVELFRVDTTAGGTYPTDLVDDIFPGAQGSYPRNLVNMNGAVYFSANDGVHGVELWTTDGTAAGTHLVSDVAPGLAGSNPEYLTVSNGLLFFAANDGILGIELWCSDGSAAGTRLVSDIDAGAASSSPRQLVAFNGYLYFIANNSAGVAKFWRSDGTAAGTAMVSNLSGSAALQLSAVNGELQILAYDTAIGYENWISDGSTAGTYFDSTPQLAAVTVAWSPVTLTTTNAPLSDLAGYKIYYGPSPVALTSVIDVTDPTATSYVVPNITPGTLYFAVSAYVGGGVESAISTIVDATVNIYQ